MTRIFFSLLLIMCTGILSSCTSKFEDFNTDKAGITEDQLKIDNNNLGISLRIIQQGIYFNYDWGKGKNWPFQIMQNLSADMYSGYMHDYNPFNGGSSNTDYNLQDGWNATMWENTYGYIFPQIQRSESLTKEQSPPFYAITKILKVLTMQRVSDYYGPVVYTQYGFTDGSAVPDAQRDVYYAFFNDLDTAVHVLDSVLTADADDANEFTKFDIILDGHYATWMKFANTLRMRLAMRMAVVEPEKARAEFLKGLLSPYGIFEELREMAAVRPEEGFLNPLGEINKVWKEAYMSAPMESILNGYDDPRRNVFFSPCPQNVMLKDRNGNDSVLVPLKGTYKGIRQGTCFSHILYASHSPIYVSQSTPAILMTAAEAWFLRAEAALRGWTDGDVQTCYERGVEVSLSQWNVGGVKDYLLSDALAADYIDAFDEGNNIAARCKVSPRWMEEADPETKLEKIITQKWLAMFPEGCEAWAEQRRTGYPRLFPVRYNHSNNGCIDTEIMIRRLNFPGSVKNTDASLYARLCTILNAPDNAGTRLWWDVGRNF